MSPEAQPLRQRLAVALDVADLAEARRLVEQLAPDVGVFKVGLELFATAGPDAVRMVQDSGADCFLDLKLHDIPATVARSVEAAARHGARYLTLHAACGPEALRDAAAAANGTRTRLLAVTVLTSLDSAGLEAIGWGGSPADAVQRLAALACRAGVDGLVASPHEVAALRRQLGFDPLLVVPGIRPEGTDAGDQRRAAQPADAISAGADVLVVGRPIRDAPDPLAAARSVLATIDGARSR